MAGSNGTNSLYLQFIGEVIPVPKRGPSAMIGGMLALQSELRNPPKATTTGLIPSMLLPIWSSADASRVRDLARLRAMRAAMAVERFRLAHGKLPEKLDELVPDFLPEVPSDPFDDKPLRYVRREKGYVIYSVGENEKDEGGAEHKPGDISGLRQHSLPRRAMTSEVRRHIVLVIVIIIVIVVVLGRSKGNSITSKITITSKI